uniref:Uncharacterized protein n=1 Tax=Odontella aurita TaxID=265563 RepID=A0A7S4MR32_9STRA|mmetsp:Transcript_29403/g.87195  ORF Transcript_29403/g.87195 Transcript_29403/m.87195 type:complete len:221 (+) Transcript_29403:1451-2113(+)
MGNAAHMKDNLKDFQCAFTRAIVKLVSTLQDDQTIGKICSKYLMSRVPFRMLAGIITNFNEEFCTDPFPWSSSLTNAVDDATTKSMIALLGNCDSLPDCAFLQATLPEGMNGFGPCTPHRSAITAFVITIARCIRCGVLGVRLNGTVHKCSEVIRRTHTNWCLSASPLLKLHWRLATDIATKLPRPKQPKYTDLQDHITLYHLLASLQHRLTRLESDQDY